MLIRDEQSTLRMRTIARVAFTLPEVLISIVILALVMSGILYGYALVNRIAVWDSMSQAAQAFAIRGMEAARAAKWNPWVLSTNTAPAPGISQDELPAETNGLPSLMQTNILDIPIKGNPLTNYTYYATNYVYVTDISKVPRIRQIWSDCIWTFPLTKKHYTNTIVTYRGPDQ